jgi:integrase
VKVYRRDGSKVFWMVHRAGGKRHRRSTGTRSEGEALQIAREWARGLDEHYAVKRTEIRLSAAMNSFFKHCQDHHLARRTVQGYAHRLRDYLEYVGDVDISTWMRDDARKVTLSYLDSRTSRVRSAANVRVPVGTFFNYLRAMNWYIGENPADAKLQPKRRPRKRLDAKKPRRRTSAREDLVLRREGVKSRLWPVILLTRWAGMRRGEACLIRWNEIDLDAFRADVVGHEGARKHPRSVWLSDFVVDELRKLKPSREEGLQPLWPRHPDTATDEFRAFCEEHLTRRLTFNDLRASLTTDCFDNGMTAKQESKIVGHSAAVAERHYEEYEAAEARRLLPGDPLLGTGGGGEPHGKRARLRVVNRTTHVACGHSSGHSRRRAGGKGA